MTLVDLFLSTNAGLPEKNSTIPVLLLKKIEAMPQVNRNYERLFGKCFGETKFG